MSDMLKQFVKKEMDRQIQKNYPHIQKPYGVYAKVLQVKKTENTYVYTLKILDQMLNEDSDFPEIPDVRSHMELSKDDIAVIILLYGGSNIYILGRYES